MCNLFNLLLNPLLISHRKDLNFGCACEQTWKPGIFSLQLAGGFREKTVSRAASLPMFRLSEASRVPSQQPRCAQPGSTEGVKGGTQSPFSWGPLSKQTFSLRPWYWLATAVNSSSDQSQRPGFSPVLEVCHTIQYLQIARNNTSQLHTALLVWQKSSPTGDQAP